MVQIWSMLAARDVRLAAHALRALPPEPPTTAWITYLRCHDDIGWAIIDEDAAAVGATGPGTALPGRLVRRRLPRLARARAGVPVQPRRPATAASSGTRRACRARGGAESAAEVDRAAPALRLAHAIVIGWGGIPVIWSGDELGQPNDPGWAESPATRTTTAGRTAPGSTGRAPSSGTTGARWPGGCSATSSRWCRARGRLVHLHGSVESPVGPVDDPGVLVTVREHPWAGSSASTT